MGKTVEALNQVAVQLSKVEAPRQHLLPFSWSAGCQLLIQSHALELAFRIFNMLIRHQKEHLLNR